ncbi:MAG: hypothetical protein MJB14_07285 [Spirochaetes bacterium]|nr:hypothetical protein [Spirochaetota bacterium]
MSQRRSASEIFKEQNVIEDEDNIDDFEEELEEEKLLEQDILKQEILQDPKPIQQMPSDGQALHYDEVDQLQASQSVKMPPITGKAKKTDRKKDRSMKRIRNERNEIPMDTFKSSEEMQLEKEPVKVRETGKWFWKKVIVPPNAYVVQTRIGKKKPVTIGLGVSFKYNPNTDSYLVVPAAMQTIGVIANCISKEKQGINILGYVQWQISDFAIAYRKLDLSDQKDPLAVVNAQLREQAEATIKDKIATMSVEEVLKDKAPIIAELKSRLKQVSEGQNGEEGEASEGLGITIATVQIKEALVSSPSLWENLQKPFRNEQKKKAELSHYDMQNELKEKALDSRKKQETSEAETNLEVEKIKQKNLTEATELKLKEDRKRNEEEQKAKLQKIKLEEQMTIEEKDAANRLMIKENEIQLQSELTQLKQEEQKAEEEARVRLEGEKRKVALELENKLYKMTEDAKVQEQIHQLKSNQLDMEQKLYEKEAQLRIMQQEYTDRLEKIRLLQLLEREKSKQNQEIQLQAEKNRLNNELAEHNMKLEKMRQEIKNILNSNVIFSQFVQQLPQIAAKMPEIKELKVLQTGDSDPMLDSMVNFVTKLIAMAEQLGIELPKKKENK